MDDKLIKDSLNSAKTIAMIGVSSIKNENTSNIVRRPSIIVMNYLQEFGYKVIPVKGIKKPNKVKAYKELPKNVKEISVHIGFGGFYEGYQAIPVIHNKKLLDLPSNS
mgnify:CR=1 FL=1